MISEMASKKKPPVSGVKFTFKYRNTSNEESHTMWNARVLQVWC